MSYWKAITFNNLKQLHGSQGVYVIYHYGQVIAIGHHTNLMCKLAGYLGSLSRVAQIDYGTNRLSSGYTGTSQVEYLKTYYAHPSECVIKYKIDAGEAVAVRLVKRLDPPWTRRERKRARSNKQARKEGKKAVTTRQVPWETLAYIEELAEDGRTYQAIAERLNARGMKSWTGKTWVASSVSKFLSRESVPEAPEAITDSEGKILYYEGSRRRYTGKDMHLRFNPKLSYKPPVNEATQSLEAMLKAS